MPMSDNMKKMHKRQEMDGCISSEYVVGGAEVSCKYGSKTCVLNLTRSHGADTLDGRPLIIKSDCTSKNISGFGVCNKNRNKPCKCEPKLNEWSVDEKSNLCIIDPNTAKGSRAITVDSITVCEKGGIVSFKTSGQATPSYDNAKVKDAVKIVENVQGSWTRSEDKDDFLGYVKVKNCGVYNFGVSFYDNGSNNGSGRIYVYEKNWGKLKLVGTYNIKNHIGIEQNKFREDEIIINDTGGKNKWNTRYWKFWADIVLLNDQEYYLEMDCPVVNTIEYKMIGNQDQGKIDSINVSGVWVLNDELKKMHPYEYESIKMSNYLKNHKGNIITIMYLSPVYNMLIRDFIGVRIAKRKDIKGDMSNFLSMVSLAFTGGTYIKALPSNVSEFLGNASLALSSVALIIALLPKSILEKIRDEMYKNSEESLIITLYDVRNKDDIESRGYNIKDFKVEVWQSYRSNVNMNVFGEKYLAGNFHMLPTQKMDIEKIKAIHNSIEEIFNNIDNTLE
ncbi:hypothetical protein HMPREF0381_2615 [Lachnoanaerobaculum saburreum DSM 3986]|uniref:DUF4280 domain-containing protein n=2 Tax=Lachnoanaerobaculum saburreum TaxID=467210 RepID=E6LRN0_9FIRM|nr:hypothetical protein HMPREF0381_2615 [Lachnoanaerobaculum saburreum DSM 3986]